MASWLDRLRSGLTGESLADMKAKADERRRSVDPGYGGAFAAADAKAAFLAILGERRARAEAEEVEGDA